MSDTYLGEIRLFSFGFIPGGWLPCDGQLLNISQNQVLYQLLGTTYGGDGKTTFALPNLQGRLEMGVGPNAALGKSGGELAHALTTAEMPQHSHNALGSTSPAAAAPPGPAVALATTQGVPLYAPSGQPKSMSPEAVGPAGSGQPHPNMMPYLVLNFCINVRGQFPQQPS